MRPLSDFDRRRIMKDRYRSTVLDTPISRREALRRTTFSAMAIATGACVGSTDSESGGNDGRLTARVAAPTATMNPGIYPIGLASGRDGLLYVPTSYRSDSPAPLALLLHGAGRDSSELVTPMRPLADTTGLVLVAPDARGATWDAISGSFFDDVTFIDRVLKNVFSRIRVDTARVRIMGFSDGGTYSLSLGLINGDLFSRIVAFSPGFIVNGPANGKPKVFITHGTRDSVLPIDQTSRQIVPRLKNAGYDVEYHEFDGGHGVTPDLLSQAVTWAAA
jgi:phospholipase/carboxylesterase